MKKLGILGFVSIIMALGAYPDPSKSMAEEVLSMEAAVLEARESNPEILAAEKNYQAAKAGIPKELMPEDPMLSYEYDEMRSGVMDLAGKPMRSYSVSQEIPFPSKLFLRSAIASKDARILYENFREKERDVIERTKKAYLELWYISKVLEITIESEALLEQFSASASARYSVAKASQQDALKAQVELAKIKTEIVLLRQKREISEANINILLNRDIHSRVEVEKDLNRVKMAGTLDDLSKIAMEKRPKLRAFRYAVEKGRLAYLAAWNEFLPDFSFSYEQMIVNGRGEDWKGMMGVTVPVWFWAKQASETSQMKAELDMFRAEYKFMENMAFLDVKSAYERVQANENLVGIYETSFIPQAEQALTASLSGYEAGQVDFLNLLDSQRTLLEIKSEYHERLAGLEGAKAELELAIGADL